MSESKNIFITGANRGLGLELVRCYLLRGARVFAACRDPVNARQLQRLASFGRLKVLTLEVRDPESIHDCSVQLAREAEGLDLLINNAGIMPEEDCPSRIELPLLREVFEVNFIGPTLLVKAMVPLLSAPPTAKVVNISSHLGSLKKKNGSSYPAYCASKAALNMMTRAQAAELKEQGITVIAMTPGWVKTDLGGEDAPITVEQSVTGMIRVIDRLRLRHSGRFYTWRGRRHPW